MAYLCRNCRKKQRKIGVVSHCTQTVDLGTYDWNDLDVGDTVYGYCINCGTRVPPHILKKLIGQAGEDYSCESIIHNLIEHREILPILIGIDPDLDKLIDRNTK